MLIPTEKPLPPLARGMGMLPDILFVLTFAATLVFAPAVSRLTRLPQITVNLTAGLASQLAFGVHMPRLLLPAHEAALACITLAAGSELVVSELRANIATIASISLLLTLMSLLLVSGTAMLLLNRMGTGLPGLKSGGLGLQAVASMLTGVVSIGRSPSSAIAVVSEQRADGPFTQTVLSVTMVTDVIVIVLFTAMAELAKAVLSEAPSESVLSIVQRFGGHTLLQLGLSVSHAACLTGMCRLLLRMPHVPALRETALLLVGGYAFGLEALLERLSSGGALEGLLRLEPMLACIITGFVLCNYYDLRSEFNGLLNSIMPPLLSFFFFSTGTNMRVGVLRHTWPMALALFGSRMLALWLGSELGCRIANTAETTRRYGWFAYVTQAGITLGLTDEIAEMFPSWGPSLQATLISVIVLNQLVGPPLFEHALRGAGEVGRRQSLVAGDARGEAADDVDTSEAEGDGGAEEAAQAAPPGAEPLLPSSKCRR